MYPYRTTIDSVQVDIYTPFQTEYNIKKDERLQLAENEIWNLYNDIDVQNIKLDSIYHLVDDQRFLLSRLDSINKSQIVTYEEIIATKNYQLEECDDRLVEETKKPGLKGFINNISKIFYDLLIFSLGALIGILLSIIV